MTQPMTLTTLEINDLRDRYDEPHRYYHTLDHINSMLAWFERVRHLAEWPEAVEAAIWYHDAIYDTDGQTDNEFESGALAFNVFRDRKDNPRGTYVNDLILATRHQHLDNGDRGLLCDLDLAAFGTDPQTFDVNEANIRREYGHVPNDAYAKAHGEVLLRFIERESVYATGYFRDRLEIQARSNILVAIRRVLE